jgi:hypothetical protein
LTLEYPTATPDEYLKIGLASLDSHLATFSKAEEARKKVEKEKKRERKKLEIFVLKVMSTLNRKSKTFSSNSI